MALKAKQHDRKSLVGTRAKKCGGRDETTRGERGIVYPGGAVIVVTHLTLHPQHSTRNPSTLHPKPFKPSSAFVRERNGRCVKVYVEITKTLFSCPPPPTDDDAQGKGQGQPGKVNNSLDAPRTLSPHLSAHHSNTHIHNTGSLHSCIVSSFIFLLRTILVLFVFFFSVMCSPPLFLLLLSCPRVTKTRRRG